MEGKVQGREGESKKGREGEMQEKVPKCSIFGITGHAF